MRLHIHENDFGRFVYGPDGEAFFLAEPSEYISYDDGELWVDEDYENYGYGNNYGH